MYWILQVKNVHYAIILEQKKNVFFIEIRVLFHELYVCMCMCVCTMKIYWTKIVMKFTFFPANK